MDRAVLREVACEEAGVDVYGRDDPGRAEPHDRPVVSRTATPPAFPAIDDLPAVAVPAWLEDGGAGSQQVFLVAKRFVAGRDHAAAEPARSQIGPASGR